MSIASRSLLYLDPIKSNQPETHLSFRPGISKGKRTAWILSYTVVGQEPRVIRQAVALEKSGWRVCVLGYENQTPCPEGWHFIGLPTTFPYRRNLTRVMGVLRVLGGMLARNAPGIFLKQSGARLYNSMIPEYAWIMQSMLRFLQDNSSLKPDLVISHDYYTADAGYRMAKRANAKFSIDCHEYARGQYMNDPQWVHQLRPCIIGLQDYFLSRADAVTTVCEGIAQLLNTDQTLKRPVTTIRSMPSLQRQSFRPTGEKIVVLYHGIISPIRGLHVAVQSMKLWRPEFHLLLRGDIATSYAAELKEIAKGAGVADRLHFEPSVAFNQIVPAANKADVGYFVHEDTGPQKRFVLPNKFFEYIMAGIALCVSDLPEMSHIVKKYGVGTLVDGFDEITIANAINSLNREDIDDMKRRSLEAAMTLNWDAEQGRLISLYEEVIS